MRTYHHKAGSLMQGGIARDPKCRLELSGEGLLASFLKIEASGLASCLRLLLQLINRTVDTETSEKDYGGTSGWVFARFMKILRCICKPSAR